MLSPATLSSPEGATVDREEVLVSVERVEGSGEDVEVEEGERPLNVLARNGNRLRAHSGPCSWIEAVGAKYLSSVAEGGAPAAKAERKAWVVWMRGDVGSCGAGGGDGGGML